MAATRTKAPIYQVKVTLKHSKPPIWRRLLVPSDIPLHQFHEVLQIAMGWMNYHLHQFIADGVFYGVPHPDFGFEVLNERRVRLDALLTEANDKLIYEYDFGDGWEHVVLLEKILERDPKAHYPQCIKGRRHCPPEDVGGVWGYGEFLEAIRNPKHPEHSDYREWVGGPFDPEAFDLDDVNAELRQIR